MNTIKVSGQIAPSQRRSRSRTSRKLALMIVESLETRQMLSGVVATVGPVSPVTTATAIPAPYFTPTDSNLADAQNGPMANLGTQSVSIYETFASDFAAAVAAGYTSVTAAETLATKIATQFPNVEFNSGSLAMDINSLGGDFNQFVTQLTNLGMVVTDTSSAYGIVEGYVPIAELPTIARLPQTEAGSPITQAITHSLQGFQGVAYNEPETTLQADAARSQFNLTGAGVTIGVLSDSVNSVGNGLSDSYATGDLLASQVTVLSGQAGTGHDEGRAMMESIHDIAPGANLQFATGSGNGDLGFMQNIEALYTAGSKIIVDDLSQSDEPYFQDGLIAQGIDYVTSRGDEYFTSAANSGTDNGYLSTFRPITATVGTGSSTQTGTFQNFDGSGSTSSPLLKITTGVPNAFINFQYDQPFKTQEPAGATATTTSNMSFYVYDASGNLVTSGTDDNVATQQPYQAISIPTQGTYYVAIKLVSGKAPGHVEFVGLDDSGAVQVDKSNGSAGGTYYPSSEGHEETVAAIGVGTTDWPAAAPFENNGLSIPVSTGSSTGPGLIDLSPKGTPIVAQLVQNPAITSADGGTTSFFGQAGINTTLYFGTPYDFTPTNQQKLFDFFGTSQAAPNAAAVAALMLQDVPTLSRVQVLNALEMSATAINNTPAGTYNIQSGYGLVNAVAAINFIAPPKTAATTTTASSSVTTPMINMPFNLTAMLASGSGTPTGSVDFYDISYNTDLGSVALAGGAATLATTPTTLGSHIYLLTYSGNSTYATSSGYLVLDVVNSSGNDHSIVVSPSPKSGTSGSTGGGSVTTHALLFMPPATPAVVPIPMTVSVPSGVNSDSMDAMAVEIASITTPESNPYIKKPTK